MKLIVTAAKNIASMNMHKLFLEEFGFKKTDKEFDGNLIYKKNDLLLVKSAGDILGLEHLNKSFKPEIYLVASTHKSESGKKTLTCHTPGNWISANMGGNPKELAIAAPFYLREILKTLKQHGAENYTKCFEVTHHGPTEMNAPVVFTEVGGTEKEWNDLDACRTICRALLGAKGKRDCIKTAVGFGGPHYAPNFSKDYVLEKVAIGHICPKYALDEVDDEVILQAFKKPEAQLAVLDWKGMSALQRLRLIDLFKENKIKWCKIASLK